MEGMLALDRGRGTCARPLTALGLGLLFAMAGLGAAPPAAAAPLAESPHDFTVSGPAPIALAPNGSCSACHKPHGGDPAGIWSRSLSQETAFFSERTDPDNAPGSTGLCYDCHDDNPSRTTVLIDDDPPRTLWNSLHLPQNIAFTDLVPSAYHTTPTKTGYYELLNGVVPSTENPGPIDGSPTGGHYWKLERPGRPTYRVGDKIACTFCHDPHRTRAGSNEALLRTSTGDDGNLSIGDGLDAARPPNTRNGTGTGRQMCAACHGYSQTGVPLTFRGLTFPRPPTTVPEHLEPNLAPCTNCHQHNRIVAGCDICHGFPPTTVGNGWSGPGDTDENYPGGAGAHLAHLKGAGKTAADPTLYAFGCLGGACHPSTLHDQGGGTVLRANVQVAFGPAWNPNGVFSAGETPAADGCSQLYCHSNGLVENGANPADDGTGEGGLSGLGEWAEHSGRTTFYGSTPASPAVWGGSLSCRGCHGKGDPNYLRDGGGTADVPVSSPDYLNAGTHAGLSDNLAGIYNTFGANSHFIHVYKLPNHTGGTCSCHGTQPDAATTRHVNRQVDVTACGNSCHNSGTYAWGDKYGSDSADSCVFWCHGKMPVYDSAGGRVTKSAASTFPLDQQPKYMQSGHGLPPAESYSSGNPGAGLACSACHLATDRFTVNGPLEASYHYERSPFSTGNPAAPLAANPSWLKTPYATDPDGLCGSCHNGTSAVAARNHSARGMIDYAAYDPKYDAPPGPWTTFTPNCVSCHDPHGEPNWFMLYDGDAERSASATSPQFSGPVIFKGSRFGVTRVQGNQYGFPPGPPYETGQVAVVMTGRSSGADFAAGDGSGICEVCHTQTIFYRQDGESPGGTHFTKVCAGCHVHPTSFAPMTCQGCHGRTGTVSPGANGIPGDADDAPNVMTTEDNGSWLSVWDGTWWDLTQGGNDTTQQGGHGDPDGKENGNAAAVPQCETCHDTDQPQPNTHFDGTYNSLGMEFPMASNPSTPRPKASPNTNTAHLKTDFFTKYLVGAGNDSSWQRAVDAYCYRECHQALAIRDMTHVPGDATVPGEVQLGRHLSRTATADLIMDSDLVTAAAGEPNYSPCVSCHNPHGSTNTDYRGSMRNRMMIKDWFRSGAICGSCHL